MLLGSHVGMSGKDMMLSSAKEAASYGANTFMVYTGAPQNTRRKDISELKIDEAWSFMDENRIGDIVVHAPYIINLANTIKPETFKLGVDFLRVEIERTAAMRSGIMVLHPGSHVGAGEEKGIAKIIEGLNEVLSADTHVRIALETMAGKGGEIGKSFEQIARIYDGVERNDRLGVCFDTCHTSDAGYDLVGDPDGVFSKFDRILGLDQIIVLHINDSKNVCGAAKDRHENIGFGTIGFETLYEIINMKEFDEIPKILETPYVKDPENPGKSYAPYKHEIAMLRGGNFDGELIEKVLSDGRQKLT